MRFLELALIASPDLTSEGQEALIEKIDKLLKKKRKKADKGEILNVNDWGVRKLSYPILKQSKGHYLFLTIKCFPDTLFELERNLKLSDDIFRFQTIRLKAEPTFEVPAVEEPAAEGEATTEKTEEVKAATDKGASEAAPAQS